MSEPCVACPFNDGFTWEATNAQNLACLPSAGHMLQLFDQSHIALSCHENQSIPCKGLSENRKTSEARLMRYSDWYSGKEVNA